MPWVVAVAVAIQIQVPSRINAGVACRRLQLGGSLADAAMTAGLPGGFSIPIAGDYEATSSGPNQSANVGSISIARDGYTAPVA